ncbi:MAG: Mannose-1-phosphate guanylyltransferase [Candidatus Shapirobacteria bacterium GW2011_GWE1_38_92]|uniref:Mannose-1-phosphate guanylyltransferase n=1 Tax=Candidatus Shapirobacteria bacterium GW2011_GWE1_38_92 TaxID=1618489 RepID=A0A0G0LGY4_9BACT|nr:MAG: Mannose-1-phosphate guanylyltransferase [Candidatus Shapirobacteria bacterium GW2011_GWE1_38_92]
MAKTSTKTPQNHFIIILCGGTGPRLWPISRADHPKQFLNLIGNESFIRQTVQRSLKILPSKNIFIVSNQKYQKQITKELKELIPPQNFIFEPDKKNTAAAILYACSIISQINPDAVITSLPSDHYISKNLFLNSVELFLLVSNLHFLTHPMVISLSTNPKTMSIKLKTLLKNRTQILPTNLSKRGIFGIQVFTPFISRYYLRNLLSINQNISGFTKN